MNISQISFGKLYKLRKSADQLKKARVLVDKINNPDSSEVSDRLSEIFDDTKKGKARIFTTKDDCFIASGNESELLNISIDIDKNIAKRIFSTLRLHKLDGIIQFDKNYRNCDEVNVFQPQLSDRAPKLPSYYC